MSQALVVNPPFNEIQETILSHYQKEPLKVLIPPNFKKEDAIVSDPLDLGVRLMTPTLDDVEVGVVAIIGSIPEVGPIAEGLYNIFAGRIKNEEEKITPTKAREMINQRVAKFKAELTKLVDQKVDASEIQQYKTNCDKMFRGFAESSFERLMSDLNLLRSKFDRNMFPEKDGSFLIGLRASFDKFRGALKAILPFFADKRFIDYVSTQYMDLVLLHALCLINLNCYWFQYGFDQSYVLGTPAVGSIKATHSFNEKIHINIKKATINLQQGITDPNILKNATRLLECDPVLYPVQLIKAPVIPSFNRAHEQTRLGLTVDFEVLEIPKNKSTPFIYRVDMVNALGDLAAENRSGFYRTIPNLEPISGCKGFILKTDCNIVIAFDSPKLVKVRLFGNFKPRQKDDDLNLKIVSPEISHIFTTLDEEVGVVDESYRHQYFGNSGYSKDFKSGFLTTPNYALVGEGLDLTVGFLNNQGIGVIYFLELIIKDPQTASIPSV